MKTIKLPENSDKYIELADIVEYTKGIILTYKNDIAIGYVIYNSSDSCWYFLNTIDVTETPAAEEEFLIDLIRYMVKRKLADDFKLIEFNQNK